MKLDKQLFAEIAEQASASPRLRMHYDLRDSADENGQRLMNVLLPGTKSAIHRHTNTSEVVYVFKALVSNDCMMTRGMKQSALR